MGNDEENSVGRVTIYSIAEACGVSASTVSRAFTRPELVSAEVRQRVFDTAERLDYRPSTAARGLVTGRNDMIGLVLPDITNPFFPPFVRAVQHAAARVGSSVLLSDTDSSATRESRMVAQLRGQVDGVIVASPRATGNALSEAAGSLPCVLVNRVLPRLSSVVCDNTSALVEAGDHLYDLGHRTVALLAGPSASWAAGRRSAAVRRWATGRDVRLLELGQFQASFSGGRQAGAALLETDATAAFAFDDLMAAGVVAELAEAGVEVPTDRSIVGCDDVLLARTLTPTLSTVAAPMTDLADTAVRSLNRLIEAPDGEHAQLRLPGMFVPRASTGPAPEPRA